MQTLSTQGLAQARELLREMQAEHPLPNAAWASGGSTLDACLLELGKRKVFESTGNPSAVRRDGMVFDPTLELQRIALAEDLVRRTDPGPSEDPSYLALLAYQAASLELAISPLKQAKNGELWSRFLLGTIDAHELNAFAQRFADHGYTIVCLYSGLVEFAYQAAKCVVPLLMSGRVSGHHGLAIEESDSSAIAQRLAANSEPAERLYRTLEAYLYNGYPRAVANETVPPQHVPLLSLLIGLSERWVVAHEYGHGLSLLARWDSERHTSHAEEYFADANATLLTALSGARLDGLPPDFAVVGGTFALASLEVARRGVYLALTGEESKDLGDMDHPSNRARAESIFKFFNESLIVHSAPNGPSDLTIEVVDPASRPRLDPAFVQRRRQRIFQFPTALLMIWKQIEPRVLADYRNGRELHPIWEST